MTQEPPSACDGERPARGASTTSATALLDEHYDFLVPVDATSRPRPSSRRSSGPPRSAAAARRSGFVRAAAALIHDRFRYEKGATHVHSSIADVLAAGAGVCQDFAHLLLALARARGLPAATSPATWCRARERERPQASSRSSAARRRTPGSRCFVPDLGWIGLDPTLGAPTSAGTSASPTAATTATSRRSAASTAAMPDSGCPSTSGSAPRSTTTAASTSREPAPARAAARGPTQQRQ